MKNESQHGPCAGRNGESGVFCNKMCSCTPTSSPVVSSAVGGCCLGGRYDVIHRSSPDHRETDGEQPQRTEENLTASLLSSNTSGKKKKQKNNLHRAGSDQRSHVGEICVNQPDEEDAGCGPAVEAAPAGDAAGEPDSLSLSPPPTTTSTSFPSLLLHQL